MSPRNTQQPSPDEAFDQALSIVQETLNSAGPVDPSIMSTQMDELEKIGLGLVGSEALTTGRFAETLHEAFSKIADVEFVPPLDSELTAFVAGKVATYAAMREATAPKGGKSSKPTDTSKIDTDERKQ